MPPTRKQPQDRKPKSRSGTFRWTAPSGEVITIGAESATLKAGTLRKLRGMAEVDQIFTILEGICDEKNLERIDELTMPELNQLFVDWQKSSGAKLPEA